MPLPDTTWDARGRQRRWVSMDEMQSKLEEMQCRVAEAESAAQAAAEEAKAAALAFRKKEGYLTRTWHEFERLREELHGALGENRNHMTAEMSRLRNRLDALAVQVRVACLVSRCRIAMCVVSSRYAA